MTLILLTQIFIARVLAAPESENRPIGPAVITPAPVPEKRADDRSGIRDHEIALMLTEDRISNLEQQRNTSKKDLARGP